MSIRTPAPAIRIPVSTPARTAKTVTPTAPPRFRAVLPAPEANPGLCGRACIAAATIAGVRIPTPIAHTTRAIDSPHRPEPDTQSEPHCGHNEPQCACSPDAEAIADRPRQRRDERKRQQSGQGGQPGLERAQPSIVLEELGQKEQRSEDAEVHRSRDDAGSQESHLR